MLLLLPYNVFISHQYREMQIDFVNLCLGK